MKTERFVAATLFFSLGLLGCGGGDPLKPEIGTVTGTITVNGQPGANLLVKFEPVDGGRTSMGETDSNGKYALTYSASLMGAKVGMHAVSIDAIEPDPMADTETDAVTSEMLDGPTTLTPEIKSESKPATVQAGSNTIDLTWP